MNTAVSELKETKNLLEEKIRITESLKRINKMCDKQRRQVEEMYNFFHELLNILNKAESKSNDEVQKVTWSIRSALMTYMLRIKSIGEKN